VKNKNAKVLFSNVCRVTEPRLCDIAAPGIVPIPEDILPPREIKVNAGACFSITLKSHRGQFLSVIHREEAERLIAAEEAFWETQSLLSYRREEYLSDPDVIEDREEFDRIQGSKECSLVIVAVIGGARSCLTVCRNIVSGCQNKERLVSDAEQALDKTNVFLVE